MRVARILHPDEPALDDLCARLTELAPRLDETDAWPAEQLRICGEAGVFEWFIAPEHGGQGWSEADVLRGYVKLAAACLTTTFVITQRTGAVQRIAAGDSEAAREELLPDLIAGRTFATVGISHLTTSRQHLKRPVLRAQEQDGGFVLDGYSPWVSGAEFAQHVVLGATLVDGRQILIAVPTDLPGVRVDRSPQLVGLSASRTGPVTLQSVFVPDQWLLAGPVHEVMKQGVGARTGGSQTSALAIGLASVAIDFLARQSVDRSELTEPAEALANERDALFSAMVQLAGDSSSGGESMCVSNASDLRVRSNSLA